MDEHEKTQAEGIILCNRGNIYQELGDQNKAIFYYSRALELLDHDKNKEFVSNILTNLGCSYEILREYNKARIYHEKSLTIRQEIGSEGGILCNLGNVYSKLGEYTKAIDYYTKALAVLEPTGHKEFIVNTLLGLGHVHNSLKSYKNAKYYYKQNLKYQCEIQDKPNSKDKLSKIDALQYLGIACYSLKEYTEAISYHEQALILQRELKDKVGEGGSLCNLGHAYGDLGEHQKAIDYYKKALGILEPIGYKPFLLNTLIGLGDTYCSLRQWKSAINCYRTIITIQQESKDYKKEMEYLLKIAAIYKQQGKILSTLNIVYKAFHILVREIEDVDGLPIANQQPQAILQELNLPLDAYPYPKWAKAIGKFAQRSTFNLILCFILGLFAFPFALIGFIALTLYRIIRNLFPHP